MANFDKSSSNLSVTEQFLAELTVLNTAVHLLLVAQALESSEPQFFRQAHERGQTLLRDQAYVGLSAEQQQRVAAAAEAGFSDLITVAAKAVGG